MKYLITFMSGVILASGAVVAARTANSQNQPDPPPDVHSVTVSGVDCPTEDSCSVSYEHGTWKITEVTP